MTLPWKIAFLVLSLFFCGLTFWFMVGIDIHSTQERQERECHQLKDHWDADSKRCVQYVIVK